jgi:hypothetical protein
LLFEVHKTIGEYIKIGGFTKWKDF